MASADEVRAALDALPAVETALRDYLAVLTPPPPSAGGHAESQVAATGTADGTIDTAAPAPGPAAVRSAAGVTGALHPVASTTDLRSLGLPGSISNGVWILGSGGPFHDLDVAAIVYYTGAAPLEFVNVRCRGVQYAANAGKSGGAFRNVTVIQDPGRTLGQGAIHFYGQTGWTIDRCDLSGFADGVQCSGPGLMTGTWVHGLALGPTTHNDGVQNYGGPVTVERCVFDLGGGIPEAENHINGALFCSTSTATFTATDLWAEVAGVNVNILNAGQSTIAVNGGYLHGGRVIGNCQLVNVERA